ncbi:AP-5 complex subunit mu isoform X2 [Primulina huaijiensis]|uniref:AP-5 complex subunit mu isoform X2 n=1 Tax=Primulina huaijiensis TaxID=1492673 RepID=UPI003CC6E03A
MQSGCSIRALWILNNQDTVIFSRKFPVVERRWLVACEKESDDNFKYKPLPCESELAAAFIDRKKREGSARGFGLRLRQSTKGSDSWVDDPITRHLISLHINNEEKSENYLLWPMALHLKGPYTILVLPLIEPHHLKTYSRMCNSSDCGSAIGEQENISSLLLELPSITGAFIVAHTFGDIITGESMEPEVVVAASPSVGGLLDSLTGSIGISGLWTRMHFGLLSVVQCPLVCTPLDLNYTNISAIKAAGFSSTDLPPADRKQPAWKPYLYRGKQRILFTIHETVHASMYDRDEIPDSIKISGQVNCRAELEGLPDVSFPLTGLDASRIESLSFHHGAQVPEHGGDKQAVTFSPPLGNFTLVRYQAFCSFVPPIKGFYQLSMVSENEGAFLFKLSLMEGYKAPSTIEFCTVIMPFPKRKVVSFDGTPSIGTVSYTENFVEWKLITNSRGVSGKSIEATFPGTVRFAPWQAQRPPSAGSAVGTMADEDSDFETESSSSGVNVEDYIMEKMSKDLQAVDLEEPFCWHAYNYAKVSFKIIGPSLSGMFIDPKSVSIFPTVKAPVECSTQVVSGDYVLWNTLGKCPIAATPEA